MDKQLARAVVNSALEDITDISANLPETPASGGMIVLDTPKRADRDAGGLFVEGNKVAGGALTEAHDTVIAAEAEDLARRILRDGGNCSLQSLSKELGWSKERLRNLLSTPQYKAIYSKVSEEFWGSIDDHMKNERMDSMVRANAITARGMTVLGSILDIVQGHAKQVQSGDVLPRATLIKAGVDAVAEARQTAAAIRAVAKDSAGAAGVTINITGKHASLIQSSFKESGVDINDVLDGYVLDAEVVSEK